jgi:stress-induced-phosphoprotein 1
MLLTNSVGSLEAYEEAVKLDPNNAQAKSGLQSVQRAIKTEGRDGASDPTGGLGTMFADPQLMTKLAANPKTSAFLADPQFMAKIQRLKENPNDITQEMGDPRFITVLGVLLGVDMSMADAPPPGAEEYAREAEEDIPMPDARTAPEPKAPEPEPEPEPEDEDTVAARKAKEEAEKEKKLGTDNYKKRNFEAAIEHYSKAWDLHKDITYLTNLGAAKFEKGDYHGAIEACTNAVEEGREVLADFKLIAKYVVSHHTQDTTNIRQSIRPNWNLLRKAQRPSQRHQQLSALSH